MPLTDKRILLVEDEMLIALDVIDALELAGCIVTGPALRLKTAIEFAVSADIDAAVLDVNLDGEFVTPVAEILVQRRIPFVLLTGFSAGVDLDNRLKSAPRLLKPLDADKLLATLTHLMSV